MTTPDTTTSASRAVDSHHEKPKKKRTSETVNKSGNEKHHHHHDDTSCSHITTTSSSPKRVSAGIKGLAAAAAPLPPKLGRGVSLGTGADAAAAASPVPSSKYSSAILGLAAVNPPNLDRGVSLGTAMSPNKSPMESPKRTSKSEHKKKTGGIAGSAVLESFKESLPTSLAPPKLPAAATVSEDDTTTPTTINNKDRRKEVEKSASYRRPKKENDDKEKLLEAAFVKAESFRVCRKKAGQDMLLDQSLTHGLNMAAATVRSMYHNKSDEEDEEHEHDKEDDHDQEDEEIPQKRASRGREKPGRPSKGRTSPARSPSGRTARSPSSRELVGGPAPRKSRGTIKKSGSGGRLDSSSPSGRDRSRSPSGRDLSRSPSGRDLAESSRRSTASKRISDGARGSPTSPREIKKSGSGGNLHSPRRKPSESTMKKSGSGGNLHSPRRKPSESTMKKVGSGGNLHSPMRKPSESTMKKVGSGGNLHSPKKRTSAPVKDCSNREMEDSSRRAKRPPTARRKSPGGLDSASDHGGKRVSESSRRMNLPGGLDSASDHGGKRISESSHRRKKHPASSTSRRVDSESPSNHAKPRVSESRMRDAKRRDDKSPRRTKSAADVDDSSATDSFPDIDVGEDDGDEFGNDTSDRNSRRRVNRSERNITDERKGRGYRGRVRKTRSEAGAMQRNQLAGAVAVIQSGDDGCDDSADEKPDQSRPTSENGNRHHSPHRLTSVGLGVGLLKNVATTVASTAANTTLNVASTTAKTTLNVASSTAKTTIGVGLNVGTATALTSLKAFTTFSHVATSALQTGKSAIYGEGANHMMLEGVPPGQHLAKIANDKDHGAIEKVNNVWKQMKKIRNYEEKAGFELFTQYVQLCCVECRTFAPSDFDSCLLFSLFEHCPPAKGVFGFPVDADPKSDAIRNSPAFKQHSTYLIKMLNTALEMLKSYGAASTELSVRSWVDWRCDYLFSYLTTILPLLFTFLQRPFFLISAKSMPGWEWKHNIFPTWGLPWWKPFV